MTHFIDRRLNPKGKSLANRQRFLRRARAQIREAVQKSLKDAAVADIQKDRKIRISTKGTKEPRFRLDPRSGGEHDFVLPGNKEFMPGDEIKKPKSADGGQSGKQAADYAEAEDDFEFTMTQEEILDIFFEDLELPNLVRTTLTETPSKTWKRAGITTAGSPTQINLIRTMRNSFGRRLALQRPRLTDVEALQAQLDALETQAPQTEDTRAKIGALKTELAKLEAKRQWVAFVDPIDIRFNAFAEQPVPASRAVMFCLMDVSGSMGEREKDLAKRFYMLLHLFLKRRYDRVDIVFIRHTHDAQEVDEQEFFYSRLSGGTIVSTALEKMLEIQRERYATADWNIYAAQASDGYTQSGDARRCVEMLNDDIMPLCQYYAYIEILDEREMEVFASEDSGAELWRAYRTVAAGWQNFATKRISKPGDIFPVFRELFRKTESAA
ncbi:MAG: YeaH/YhbH family protein [Alphaproteobacteria bacterium]|nr:YeaH/YhbH family protein [Alphaproteobacteria bacterium]MBV9063796.1 YeaH/YhbH family protein [Alphaproteobacteria bacterium]